MKNTPSPVALNNTDGFSGDNGQEPNFGQEVVHNNGDQQLIKEEDDAEEEVKHFKCPSLVHVICSSDITLLLANISSFARIPVCFKIFV